MLKYCFIKQLTFFTIFILSNSVFLNSQELLFDSSSYEANGVIYCNGIYPGPVWFDYNLDAMFFHYDFFNLNRNNFEIQFEFLVAENVNRSPIILSDMWTLIFGFSLGLDGSTAILTNDGSQSYRLNSVYIANTWHRVSIRCQYRLITILFDNNPLETIVVNMNTIDGNNGLSSINFSSEEAFYGYLRNIKVFSWN